LSQSQISFLRSALETQQGLIIGIVKIVILDGGYL
jgi:hypothetical protein